MARALVVTHSADEGVDNLGTWLQDAGLELAVVEPWAGDELPTDPTQYDALVVMGGPQQAYDDGSAPWLAATKDLLRAAVEQRVPTLGVCLGAQLLAEATGGRVAPGDQGVEAGARLVAKRDAAWSDELLADVPLTPTVFQWHEDAIVDLPPGAVHLAAQPALREPGVPRRRPRVGAAVPRRADRRDAAALGRRLRQRRRGAGTGPGRAGRARRRRARGGRGVLAPDGRALRRPRGRSRPRRAAARAGLTVLRAVPYDDPDAVRLVDAMGVELAQRYGDGGLSPAEAQQFSPPGVFLLAERDGTVVGCAGLRVLEPGVGEVKRMYVDLAVRGRGVARELLAALVQHARDSGLERLLLETGSEQPEAVALYESEGWTPVPAYGHYADDPRTRCYGLALA